MIIRPRATSDRTNSDSRFSRRPTYSISDETIPCRAISICVILQASRYHLVAAANILVRVNGTLTYKSRAPLPYNNARSNR